MSQVVSPESQSTTRPHVAFVTMGCAKNEVDTEKMKSRLSDAGYHCDDDVSTADVIVVNTCSFIQDATEESLEMIFDMADLDCVASGNTKIVVAGCMPARYGFDLEEELTEASSFVPCARECDIVEVVDECLGLDRSALPDAGSIVEPGASADATRSGRSPTSRYPMAATDGVPTAPFRSFAVGTIAFLTTAYETMCLTMFGMA